MKTAKLLLGAIPVLVLLSAPLSGHLHAQETAMEEPSPIASGIGGVVEGKVMEVENHTLVIENSNGKTVRVRMPGKSGKSSSDFSKGNYIEAAVSPEGITTSVRILENMQKH
ncbi:MAG: hypothetical protein KC592_18005 [Nitrospira sp.]|nr:hypothetical protein [Nitrospira sp.]